jgi:hypothetical protein
VQWKFLNTFILFLVAMVQPVGYGIFKRDDFPGIGCCSRIGHFIIELSVFGGLKVIQDYLQLVKNALQIRSDTNYFDWASSFEPGYLKRGESLLCKYPEDHLPYLTLSSDMGRNMRYMFGNHIHLGRRELDANDIYL